MQCVNTALAQSPLSVVHGGESGVLPSWHDLDLVSSGAPQGLSAPLASPGVILRGNETHGSHCGPLEGWCFYSLCVGPLPWRRHAQVFWTSQVSRSASVSSFLREFLNSKSPHRTCEERVKTVLGSGWGLSEPLFTSGFGRPGPVTHCCFDDYIVYKVLIPDH